MKQIILSMVLFLSVFSMVSAQEGLIMELSVKQCVEMAIERNINVETARIEQEKSGYQVNETRAALLPKINFSGSFQDNIELSKTVLSGDLVGPEPQTLTIGSKFNATAGVSASMVLYNQTAITALKITKKLETIGVLGVEKASQELAVEVAELYFLSLTTSQQKELMAENISRAENQVKIVRLLVDNGMAKDVDLDRIIVSLENLYSQISNVETTYNQQLNMIKYLLDIPLAKTIVLTDSVEMPLLVDIRNPTDFSDLIDIEMLESQQELNKMNIQKANSAYLPTLSLSAQYAVQGLRTEFGNYFNGSGGEWFPVSYVGINLSVPIFNGFEKLSKTQQAKLDYQKTSMLIDNTQQRLSVDYQNAKGNYENQRDNVERQGKNIELAEKVYTETALKYKEGLASMSDLLQDETSLNAAQSGWLNALYNFKEAELQIMELNGEIKNLINKTK